MFKIKSSELLDTFYLLRSDVYQLCLLFLRGIKTYEETYSNIKLSVYNFLLNPEYVYFINSEIKNSLSVNSDIVYFEASVASDLAINRPEDSVYLKLDDRAEFILRFTIMPILNLIELKREREKLDNLTLDKKNKAIELMEKMFHECKKLGMTNEEYFNYLKKDFVAFASITNSNLNSKVKVIEKEIIAFNFDEII